MAETAQGKIRAEMASTSLIIRKIGGLFRSAAKPLRLQLLEDAEPDDPDDDQVDRNDVIQQPRHQQNEDSTDERHDGGDVADADGHARSPGRWGPNLPPMMADR